jgi:hypothetical protein
MTTIPVFWVSTVQCSQRAHDATLQRDGSSGKPVLAEADSGQIIKPGQLSEPIHLDLDVDPTALTPEQRELLLAAVRRDRPHFAAGVNITALFSRKELDGDAYVPVGELIMGKRG